VVVSRSRVRPRHAVALALGLWTLDMPWLWGSDVVRLSTERYDTPRFVNAWHVGRWLRGASTDGLYVLGSEPQIYLDAGVRPPTRYVIQNPLFGGFASSRARQREVWEAVRRARPRHVVVAHPRRGVPMHAGSDEWLLDRMRELLRRDYRVVAYTRRDWFGMHDPTAAPITRETRLDLVIYERRPARRH
jgi:hypothetical protein